MLNNAALAYSARKVETASPAELTLMLYEGAIKFCNIAASAIERKDYEKANLNIQKARNIVVELQSTLNHKYAIAKEFDVIYDYIFHRLVDANMKKDSEALEAALVQLRDMRDAWKEVMRAAKGPVL